MICRIWIAIQFWEWVQLTKAWLLCCSDCYDNYDPSFEHNNTWSTAFPIAMPMPELLTSCKSLLPSPQLMSSSRLIPKSASSSCIPTHLLIPLGTTSSIVGTAIVVSALKEFTASYTNIWVSKKRPLQLIYVICLRINWVLHLLIDALTNHVYCGVRWYLPLSKIEMFQMLLPV